MNRCVPCRYVGQRRGARAISSSPSRTAERNLTLESGLRARYQSSALSMSCHAWGWKRYGLAAGIREPGQQAAAHFFVRNHLNFPRVDLLDAALDLLRPGCFDTFLSRLVVKTFKQRFGQCSACL